MFIIIISCRCFIVDGQGYLIAHHMMMATPKDADTWPRILDEHITDKFSIHMYIYILLFIILCARVHACMLGCVCVYRE